MLEENADVLRLLENLQFTKYMTFLIGIFLKKKKRVITMAYQPATMAIILISELILKVLLASTVCPNCRHDMCITDTDTHCLYGCKTGFWGGRCWNLCTDQGCPQNIDCYRDSVPINNESVYDCVTCDEGSYRGTTCETFKCLAKCPKNCISCSSAYECHDCKAPFYNQGSFRNCISKCPDNCVTCLSPSLCTECKQPHFNNGSVSNCSLWSCPETCKECNGKLCSECRDGYYNTSNYCESKCPANCLSCSSKEECNLCKTGYYSGYTNDVVNCLYSQMCEWPCRQNCLECKSYNSCQKCTNGTYGSVCEKQCSDGCMYGTCDKDTGSCMCKALYSGDKCCASNPNCKYCSSITACRECRIGYFGQSCEHSCSSTCLNGCHKSSGECTFCATDRFGRFCEHKCSPGCLSTSVGSMLCNSSSGVCSNGCIADYFSDRCDQKCPELCSNYCDTRTGHCLSCSENTYGPSCNHNCSENCKEINGTSCNKSSGVCLTGCKPGYYGELCTEFCSKQCLQLICDRLAGSCLLEQEAFGSTSMSRADKDDYDKDGRRLKELTLAVGCSFVLTVVLMLALAFLVIHVRRRRRRNSDGNYENAREDKINATSGDLTAYENMDYTGNIDDLRNLPAEDNLGVYENTTI